MPPTRYYGRDLKNLSAQRKMSRREALKTMAGAASGLALLLGGVGLTESNNVSAMLTKDAERIPGEDASLAFVRQYRETITAAAREYEIPPEFVASLILTENQDRSYFEDMKDVLGVAFRRNVSIDVGQIRISTAMELEGIVYTQERFEEHYDRIVKQLQQPDESITLMAQYSRRLANRRLNSPSAQRILADPSKFALLASLYGSGEGRKEVSGYGLRALSCLVTEPLLGFFDTASREEHPNLVMNAKIYIGANISTLEQYLK